MSKRLPALFALLVVLLNPRTRPKFSLKLFIYAF